MHKNFLAIAAIVALVVPGQPSASTTELPPITVTGVRPWGYFIVYDSAVQNAAASFRMFDDAWRGYMDWDQYQEERAAVAAAVNDKTGSPDARCNILASAATKSVTSKSDQTDRYLAAHQLFSAIQAAKGVAGVKAVLGGSKPQMFNGKMASTFTITYVDGGTESWPASETLAPARIFDQPVGPPPTGDGVPKQCPYIMRG